ncbi:MAG: hypothetical protein FWD68_07775 [Alphaproteobacteria bacterium]|nr:hypothetical protein [Alphaproteobacteria bacterium]
MKSQRPIISDDEHQVLPFRPRATQLIRPRLSIAPAPNHRIPIRRLAPRPATPPRPGDDFRHRILGNMAALALTMALTALGIWLVARIAHLS